MAQERPRRQRSRRRFVERKDRLIQTRVAEDLEQTLKREAARRRLTVSHLIRNTLEDAFHLVEGVTHDVGQLVTGSVELAAAVSRDAKRIASIVRGQKEAGESGSIEPDSEGVPAVEESVAAEASEVDPLAHVYGWNRVIANREAACAKCAVAIERGEDALVGISDDATKPRAWLCAACAERL